MSAERRRYREAAAYIILACAALAIPVTAVRISSFLHNPVAWRAIVVPAVIALLQVYASARLLRTDSRILAVATLSIQLIAFSVGPIAYRMISGPYVALVNDPRGMYVGSGVDANLLLMIGDANHVPPGISINLIVLAILVAICIEPSRAKQPA